MAKGLGRSPPSLSLSNAQNSAVMNAIPCRDDCVRLLRFEDFPHSSNAQFSGPASLSVRRPVSFDSIGRVVCTGSSGQMSGIDATAIVTGMTNDQRRWDLSIGKAVCDAMRVVLSSPTRGKRRSADLAISVVVVAALPGPALIRPALVDLAPKFLRELRASSKRLGSYGQRLRIARPVTKLLSIKVRSNRLRNLFTANRARFHAVIIAVFSLSGCAHNNVIDTSCAWVRPIMISRHDVLTDETARAILTHNEAWQALCHRTAEPRR
jgi:hypothetical protein